VTLSEELETVRAEIKQCVLNGAGGIRPGPPAAARRKAGREADRQQARGGEAGAQEAARQIMSLLRERTHRMAEIAASMGSRHSTISERLRRLQGKGLIERSGTEWATVATATP
jgi:hypothetical protein